MDKRQDMRGGDGRGWKKGQAGREGSGREEMKKNSGRKEQGWREGTQSERGEPASPRVCQTDVSYTHRKIMST